MNIDNNVEIKIVKAPIYVTFECPFCKSTIEIKYSDFTDLMINEYYGDWLEEEFECPECNENVKIEYIDWD